MSPGFLLDEHISPDVARGCQARGVDVLSLAEAGLLQADDHSVFRAAVREGRILVTYNNGDFARLFGDLLKEGSPIPGIIFIDPRTIPPSDIGGLVRALVRVSRLIERGDVDPSAGVFLNRK